MAHLTNFSFEFFYKIFTEEASQPLLYHGAKRSKMTKNSNQGGGSYFFLYFFSNSTDKLLVLLQRMLLRTTWPPQEVAQSPDAVWSIQQVGTCCLLCHRTMGRSLRFTWKSFLVLMIAIWSLAVRLEDKSKVLHVGGSALVKLFKINRKRERERSREINSAMSGWIGGLGDG